MTYTYDAAGQLKTRIWARKENGTTDIVTTYGYDPAGRLTGTDYSDDTADVAITLDRAGRPMTITDASGTRTHGYNGPGTVLLSALSYSGADSPLAGLTVAYGFASARRASVSVVSGTQTLSSTGYQYDPATGRMNSVSHAGQEAVYDWTTQVGGLPGKVVYSGVNLTGTRTPDTHGRLDDITWRQGAGTASPLILKNDYTLDDRGRRTATTREDNVNWSYGYNDRSEVTSGSRGGQVFGYAFDEIGNRTQATETGVNDDGTQTITYNNLDAQNDSSTNGLNQYTKITNPDPGKRKIKGQANADATVTVTQSAPGVAPVRIDDAPRTGTAFTATAEAATTNAPAFLKVTIEGSKAGAGVNGQPIVARKESGFYFPPKEEAQQYDEDGNLIQDGRWTWTWDAENRLKAMETTAAAATAGVPKQRLEFVYDSQSRRVRKVVKNWEPGTGNPEPGTFVVTTDTRFLYDGWNVIAEFNFIPQTSSFILSASYAWGLDLSATETGAGGVGGLVLTAVSTSTTGLNNIMTSQQRVLAPLYDGNGNVLAYAICSTGQIVARYEYDPFGKLLIKDEDASVTGRLHHQFSTKYLDEETGLSYYGFRYYSTEMGRWLSRDPIAENGGINLNSIPNNDLIGRIDKLGKQLTPSEKEQLLKLLGTPTGFGGAGTDCVSYALGIPPEDVDLPPTEELKERGCRKIGQDESCFSHEYAVYRASYAGGGDHMVKQDSNGTFSHQTGESVPSIPGSGAIFTGVSPDNNGVATACACYGALFNIPQQMNAFQKWCCPVIPGDSGD